MGEATFQRTFAGGELAPALHSRADTVKYVSGLRTCKNAIVLRSGGVANRAGFRFVAECKTNSISVKLIRYVSEVAGESILIEVGNGYLRFFKNGGAVEVSGVPAYNPATDYVIGDLAESGGVNYYCKKDCTGIAPPNATYWYPMPGDLLELPSPFGTSLCEYVQSGRVISLTSGAGVVPPHELIYVDVTKWIIRQVMTEPSLPGPTGVTATAGVAGTMTRKYQVTAGAEDSYEESLPAGTATLPNCGDPTTVAPHIVQWNPVTGAAEYYVYCDPYGNGTFGFVGTATGMTSFRDVGFVPDFSITPPMERELFNASGQYPRCAAVYQQRRFFANTVSDPDAIFGSRVGFTSNFNVSSPLQDDDAITFKVVGNQHNPVRHLVGLKSLIVLTDAGEWTIRGAGGVLTPNSILGDQETYVGVAPEPAPVVVGNSIIYIQTRGAIVRDLRFDQEVEGLAGRDLTIFASHLFDGYTILDMDFQQTPHSIVWLTRSDGTLLGLTYLREQEIWGWHRHTTQASGRFEHVCVVPEQTEDVLYVITRRTIGGAYHRFIERLEARDIFNFAADSFFVDAGLSYDGAPALTFSGLDHIEGERVAILADGQVVSNGYDGAAYTVVGGAVTLPAAASVVHIGLPILWPDIETLSLDVQGSNIRDKLKRIGSLGVLVDTSTLDFWVGRDESTLLQYKELPYEVITTPWTGRAEQALITGYDQEGRVLIRQRNPTPLTVLGILPNVEPGG